MITTGKGVPQGVGKLFVKFFKNLLTNTFLYGNICTVRQYKINVVNIYVLRLEGRSGNMSGYRQGKRLLGPMHIMRVNISHKSKHTH